jgi:hypothetical protein
MLGLFVISININVKFYGTMFIMSNNIVKSADVNKVNQTKKIEPKIEKVHDERNPNEFVAQAPAGFKFILFESGASYTSRDGFKFTKSQKIHLFKNDEADQLLKFTNFRIPDQIELQEYAGRME